MLPRSLAIAPPDAVSLPFAGTGGQLVAQAPEQLDLFMLSAANRYTVRPEPSVRNIPVEPECVVITALVDAPAGLALDGDPLAGLAGLAALAAVPPLLLHAAAIRAAASGKLSLTGTGIRASNEFFTAIVSCPGRDDLVRQCHPE